MAVGHGSGAQAAALALLGDQDSPVVQAACLLDPVDGLPSRPRQAVRDVQDALSNPAVLGSADEKRALRAALEAIAQGLPEEEEEGSGSPVLPLLAASREMAANVAASQRAALQVGLALARLLSRTRHSPRASTLAAQVRPWPSWAGSVHRCGTRRAATGATSPMRLAPGVACWSFRPATATSPSPTARYWSWPSGAC